LGLVSFAPLGLAHLFDDLSPTACTVGCILSPLRGCSGAGGPVLLLVLVGLCGAEAPLFHGCAGGGGTPFHAGGGGEAHQVLRLRIVFAEGEDESSLTMTGAFWWLDSWASVAEAGDLYRDFAARLKVVPFPFVLYPKEVSV